MIVFRKQCPCEGTSRSTADSERRLTGINGTSLAFPPGADGLQLACDVCGALWSAEVVVRTFPEELGAAFLRRVPDGMTEADLERHGYVSCTITFEYLGHLKLTGWMLKEYVDTSFPPKLT